MSSESLPPKKLLIKPIIISNNKKMIIKSPKLLANIKFPAKPIQQYKEEVIYSSPNCDFLKGESQNVLIINRLNLITKNCRTVAKCTSSGNTVETSSDSVCSVIGQKNYETVLSALSSVFNEETKVRGILALLGAQKKFASISTQTEMNSEVKKNLADTSCQTEDTRLNMFARDKQRKRIRRQQLTPYVVTERPPKVKKFVININDVKKDTQKKKVTQNNVEKKEIKEESLPDLKLVIDEDSNMSCGSVGNISLSSLPSVTGILDNPHGILSGIDKVTDKTLKPTGIPLRDGSIVMVPIKPEDMFHIATPEILKNVTREERMKLIWHQAFIDFKMCLEQDEDGYYPLHIAVLSNDADLVRRQCVALRARHESVDIPAGGLTALHMSVRQNASTACTTILLQNGADPLLCDQERRCGLHLAAETESPQLRAVLAYCDTHARSVLKNNLDFWRPEHEAKTDEQLKAYLYKCVSEMFDDQGYTPLMAAAEAAIPANVSLLAARAGALVDARAPTCGATALHRAVTKACIQAKETGNRVTAADKILKTIEILVEHGADPSIENHSGSSVNSLLTEFNISALSMTIANKMTAMKHGKATDPNMILYKHNDGRIAYKDINNTNKTEMTEVRNIPPGLHAIITIDIPKPKEKTRKEPTKVKTDDKKVGNVEAKSSKRDLNEIKKNKVRVKRPGITDLILDNAMLKDAIKDRNIDLNDLKVNGLNSFLKTANETAKDVVNITNIQVKLSKVVLKQAKPNINISIKDNLNKDAVKVLNEFGVKLAENVKHNADNKTDLKQTNINNDILSIANVSKDTSPDVQAKSLSINNENTIDTSKVDTTVDTSLGIHDTTKELKLNDTNTTNKNEDIESNETPTRSAKERKTDKIVIVENVALKKVFPIPNILRAGNRSVQARDIVISQSRNKVTISPKITNNDEIIHKFRKRKLE